MCLICWNKGENIIEKSILGGLLSLMSSLFGEIHNNIMVGPVRVRGYYEQRSVHSNEKMKSIKSALRKLTNHRH